MSEMSEMSELEHCPFCLGRAVLVPTSVCSGHISCIGECGMETAKFWDSPMTSTESQRTKWYEIASAAWNRRPQNV